MSAVFANGNKEIAIAQIRAEAVARWVATGDGSRTLDAEGLTKWVTDEFAKMYPDGETPNNQAHTLVNPRAMVNGLNYSITKEKFVSRDDYPKAAEILTGVSLLQATRAGQAELDRMVAEIAGIYQALKKSVPQQTQWYATQINTEVRMPLGVDRVLEDIVYRYTYVTDWGEESAPSPPSAVASKDQNDTTMVTMAAPPTGRFVTKWRLYRSSMGNATAAYLFVKEGAISGLTTPDAVLPAALGEVLPTEGWFEPPPNIRGVVALPNGIMAGFFDNTICFCDPYHPYAWPIEYQVTLDQPIVCIAPFEQGLLASTRSSLFVVSGADSASMSATRVNSDQICISPRGMAPMGGGVTFISPDGICHMNSGGVTLLTEGHYTREEWRYILYNAAESTHVGAHDGVFFIFTAGESYFFDLATNKLGILPAPDGSSTAAWSDPYTDSMYVCQGTSIVALFNGPTKRMGKWRSKLITLDAPAQFAWLQVKADFDTTVKVRWIADGVQRYEVDLVWHTPVRLPPGRWAEHEIEILSQSRITEVILASSTEELKAV